MENPDLATLHDKDIIGYLRTSDGFIFLRKSIPNTFDIALKLLELMKKRAEGVALEALVCEGQNQPPKTET